MILGIAVIVLEAIILPITLSITLKSGGPLSTFFNDFFLIAFMVLSLVNLIVCLVRIFRMHGNRKGRALTGVICSGITLIAALVILIYLLSAGSF